MAMDEDVILTDLDYLSVQHMLSKDCLNGINKISDYLIDIMKKGINILLYTIIESNSYSKIKDIHREVQSLMLHLSLTANTRSHLLAATSLTDKQDFNDFIKPFRLWWKVITILYDYYAIEISVLCKSILQVDMSLNNCVTNYKMKLLEVDQKSVDETYKLELFSLYVNTYCNEKILLEELKKGDTTRDRCIKAVMENISPGYFRTTEYDGITVENVYKLTNNYLLSQFNDEKQRLKKYSLNGLFTLIPSESLPHIAIYGFSTSHKEKRIFKLWYTPINEYNPLETLVKESKPLFPPFTFSKYVTFTDFQNKLSNDNRYYIVLCRTLIYDTEVINKPANEFPSTCFEKKQNYYHSKTKEFLLQRHQSILPEFIIQFHYIPKLHYVKLPSIYPIDLRGKKIEIPSPPNLMNLLPEDIYNKNPESFMINLVNPYGLDNAPVINYDNYSVDELNQNCISQCEIIIKKAKEFYTSLLGKLYQIEELLFQNSLSYDPDIDSDLRSKFKRIQKNMFDQIDALKRKNEDLSNTIKKTRNLERIFKIRPSTQ